MGNTYTLAVSDSLEVFMGSFSHLTIDDRITIAESIKRGDSFKSIARILCKDCSTISKEVKLHTYLVQTGCYGRPYNNCKYALSCSQRYICKECIYKRARGRCSFCNMCNSVCELYTPVKCKKLTKPPYVCNACPQKGKDCTLEKHIYDPIKAHKEYELFKSESRTGISMTEDEIRHLDELVSPLISQHQSIHHIFINHRDEIMCSENTIYRLIDNGILSAKNIDLPRKVRFRKRRKKKEYKVDKACRIGRNYQDFLNFYKNNSLTSVVEIDSVIGNVGGKALLTIHFVKASFMLAFIREHNDSHSVIQCFDYLYELLGHDTYSKLFYLLKADNGSEFSNPTAIELNSAGIRRSYVFYCDPQAPYQKGAAERNHQFIRMFIPKGKSFNHLTQENVSLMMNHINSYARKDLGDKSPYEMMEFLYGKGVLDALGYRLIPADQICLGPEVFRKEV